MKFYLAQKQKMIIDKLHFERQLNNINQILWKKDFNVTLLRKMPLNNFKKEDILNHYSLIFQNFPLTIENSADEIGISHFATEFFEFYYECFKNHIGT